MKINMQSTSLDAWFSIQGIVSDTLDGEIVESLYKVGHEGLMCWQIEEDIGRNHQAVSGNLRHLVERGAVVKLHKQGITRSGRRAYYWALPIFFTKNDPRVCQDTPTNGKKRLVIEVPVGFVLDENAAYALVSNGHSVPVRVVSK